MLNSIFDDNHIPFRVSEFTGSIVGARSSDFSLVLSFGIGFEFLNCLRYGNFIFCLQKLDPDVAGKVVYYYKEVPESIRRWNIVSAEVHMDKFQHLCGSFLWFG